jgi:hypothetical protein
MEEKRMCDHCGHSGRKDKSKYQQESSANTIRVGFCTDRFPAGVHICLVYRDEAERQRVVGRFVESGLMDGENVAYFADTASSSDVLSWMEDIGLDLPDSREPQELSVQSALDTYCPDGTFIPERMYTTLKTAYDTSVADGYTNVRVTGEMSWALRGMPGSERLIEYEAGVNTVLKTHPVSAMCQYDANRFSGTLIYEALEVHPYMVMKGQLVRNPYYRFDGG